MKQSLIAALILATGALMAGTMGSQAQSDVVAQRTTILKTFGAGVREPGAMLRGEAPFDLVKVQATLATIKAGAPQLPPLFPDASLGAPSKAMPLIATERAQFNAIFAKLEADVTAAQAAITSEATFKTEFPKVLANCGACHRPYQAK
jgi:cytochrome c556